MEIATQSSIDLAGIKKVRSGKVREVFDLGETLLFVVTDRISAKTARSKSFAHFLTLHFS